MEEQNPLYPYLKNAESDWYRQRLTLLFLAIAAIFLLLASRLFYLQILQGEEFARLSENNCIRLRSIPPHRGLIYDRNETLLVDNRPAYDLMIVPRDARPVAKTLQRLATISGLPEEELTQKLQKNRKPGYRAALLRQDIDRDTVAAVSSHRYELPGIRLEVKPRRHYMFPGLASHVIGYLGEVSAADLKKKENRDLKGGDTIGKVGIERVYDMDLRGTRGGRQVEVNAKGQIVRVLQTVPADPGANLILSIDLKLQKKAEELLQEKAGAIVALDPENGQVLAMASSPTFDQNLFVTGLRPEQWKALITNPDRPMENKAIQGEYPPASPYKIISAMAALEEGVVDANTRFFCSGSIPYGDRNFRCWKRGGHGSLNLEEAIEHSCDVYFYEVAQKLRVDRLAWYARAAGMGAVTGIDLDHEGAGLVPTAAWKKRRTGVAWQGGETLSVVIGQGYNLATPLQAAVMTAAIANGGTLYRPQVVKETRKADGAVIRPFSAQVTGKLPIGPENLRLIRKGLWDVVNRPTGTAYMIRSRDVEIFGKTGTAQVISRKGEDENGKPKMGFEPHAWFVAFASGEPSDIAVSVIVEHGEAGSRAAGPIARDLILHYLGRRDV